MEQVEQPEIDADRLVAEYARDLILVLDPKGFILRASPSVVNLLGRDPRDLVGIHCTEHIHPDDRERQRDVMRERVITGEWRRTDLRVQHVNGSWLDIESVGVPIVSSDGEIRQVIITGRDVTERKAVERRLRASEERMRLVMQQLPVNVWTTNRDLVVTSSVGGGLVKVGLVPDELVGVSLEEFFRHDPIASQVTSIHRRNLARRTPVLKPTSSSASSSACPTWRPAPRSRPSCRAAPARPPGR